VLGALDGRPVACRARFVLQSELHGASELDRNCPDST
jgi:hypothetical protein